MMRLLTVLGATASLIARSHGQAPPGDFGQPEGVDLWCGRTYRPEHPVVQLGGGFKEPPVSEDPLFRLHARSRMNIYLDTDEEASILVDANIVHQGGESLPSCFWPKEGMKSAPVGLEISYDGKVLKSTEVNLDTVDNEITISLDGFETSFDAHQLTVKAIFGKKTTFTDTAELLYLPYPEDYGSVSRLDDLYGGLHVQRGKENPWEVIFPYTYYSQWTRYWNADEGAAEGRPNISTLEDFTAKGYNVIHPVPTGSLGQDPIPWDEWLPYVERANELGLWFRYDVNLNYDKGLENTRDQIEGMKRQPSLLLWYHSDESDGKTWPLEPMREGYEAIKELDPYHPVSLVLNCYDWHYQGYSNATDIVASDVYPIGINATFSIYGTVCNETYGVCGCDMCEGSFKDIYSHMDEFVRRDELIRADKTHWFTPQAFGNETHWDRIPTGDELAVMTILSINHGAKGIVQWDYPSYPDLEATSERLAKVLPTDEVATFFLGAPLTKTLPVEGSDEVDAAAWVDPESGEILVSVVNMSYRAQATSIKISLPPGDKAASVKKTFLGERSWAVEGNTVVVEGLSGLEVSMFSLSASS